MKVAGFFAALRMTARMGKGKATAKCGGLSAARLTMRL